MTALIEDRSGRTRILHLGDELGEWRLEQILDDRVVMASDGKRETLLVHRFDPIVTEQGTIRARRPTPARPATRRPTTNSPTHPATGRVQQRP